MKLYKAFTLIELLVVVTIISILAALLLPVLNHAKQQSQGIECLSNQKQMTLAWKMYTDDNRGIFPLNASEKDPQTVNTDWVIGILGWKLNTTDNTNIENLQQALLGSYVINQTRVYKCPADIYNCIEEKQSMPRVRSISMNGYVGQFNIVNGYTTEYVSGTRAFAKESDLDNMSPSMLWIFLDEHPDSINDGFFLFYENSLNFVDTPANYHNGSCSFGFSDGHAEIHKWINNHYWWTPECIPKSYIELIGIEDTSDAIWMAKHSTISNN